ncbi:hypothetical protein BJV74DRAFT_775506 [Russula compacta]|nr:hypothetical protein BJV74DRAFT_775506 [Russula compacta]
MSETDRSSFWEDSSPSGVSSIESSRYDVSKLEAHLYYFGIRGLRRRGPKLIFRTSKDIFTAPSRLWPKQDPRVMRLRPVYEHHKLGKDNLWATIRSKVVELLDQRNIMHSSIDLVRFSWVEENKGDEDDEENEDDEDNEEENEKTEDDNENNEDDVDDEDIDVNIKVALYRTVITTPVTIWVGVLPDTLTGEVAFHSSNDILDLLNEDGISDVDVAYRESVARGFSGPELFAPVSILDPLKAVIDPVTTALGLPIAGLKTLYRQGTMGFYFRVGKDLYAVTARHVLFPEDEGNNSYSYHIFDYTNKAGPKKKVVLMGSDAFTNFLVSIQHHISILNRIVCTLEEHITTFTARSEGGGPNTEQAEQELVETQCELRKTQTVIEELEKFFMEMKKQWTKPKDRVIGHVIWAPPISVSAAPHSYTKDVCVVKLDKKKFSQNFRRNVLNLGPEIDSYKLINLIYSCTDPPSNFNFLGERLLELRGILSAEEIRTPNNKDQRGDTMRYVIKRGLTTLTTIGCLNGFESHVRRYFTLGSCDSVEAAVYRYDSDSCPFSRGGDSGSIIADTHGKFVALLTSGTGSANSSDITYGSPMYWLWGIIKAEFPGANLYFEDDDN